MYNKYFVTGGAGFVGSHTVDALVASDAEVTVFDIKPWKEAVNLHHLQESIAYVEGDIRDYSMTESAMRGHTHVLHLAAIVSVPLSVEDPIGTHATNVTGTLNVFRSAEQAGVTRAVYASSAAVYGEQKTFPITEDAELFPLSPYGLHKVMNEEYARMFNKMYGLSVAGLRYFNIFGERQDPSSPYSGVVSIFVDRILKSKEITIFGDGTAVRDFVHVDNIVKANIQALQSDCRGVYNVGSGVETSMVQLVDVLTEITETDIVRNFVEERTGDILRSCASIEKAKSMLGYSVITDFKNGLSMLLKK